MITNNQQGQRGSGDTMVDGGGYDKHNGGNGDDAGDNRDDRNGINTRSDGKNNQYTWWNYSPVTCIIR